jgi:TPR repeat protein
MPANMPRLTAEKFAALRSAAEHGDINSQYLAGAAYLNGNGVVRDIALGEKWLLAAAERNHVAAQCDLGALYLDGRILKQSYFDGLKWLSKAAEKGDAVAMAGLGSLNAKGFRERSVGFFERVLYANMGVDRIEAYKWFSLALRAGHAAAEKDLWLLRRLMSAEEIREAERKVDEYVQTHKRAG